MKKKLFFLFMCFVVMQVGASNEFKMCGVTITDAIAASGIIDAISGIDGVTATGTITYDPSTHTMTMNNAVVSYSGDQQLLELTNNASSYYGGVPLTIVLEGTNKLSYVGTGYKCAIALVSSCDLTITGSGSLELYSQNWYAIHTSYGKLTIDNTTIIAKGGEYSSGIGNNSIGGSLYINKSNVTSSQILRLDYLEITDCYIISPKGAEVSSTLPSGGYGIDKKGQYSEIVISSEMPATTYTVTLVQPEHGSLSVVEAVDLNEVPENTLLHFVATPDANYELDTWTGCKDGLLTVTENSTVTCTFKEKKFNITLSKPTNGTVSVTDGLGNDVDLSQQVLYNTELVFTATPNSGYKFDQYLVAPEGESMANNYNNPMTLNIIKNTNVQVIFVKKQSFEITIVQPEHGTISLQEPDVDLEAVEEGTVLHFVATPDEGYELDEWSGYDPDKSLTVSATASVTCSFKLKTFSVTFVDYDDKILKEPQVVNWGSEAIAPASPEREGYDFIGWDADFSTVKSDMTITALYEIKTFNVTFVDHENNIIKTEVVDYGKSATAPETPEWEGHVFVRWNADFSGVKSDLTVSPIFEAVIFTVQFVDWDGTVLKTETVEYGNSVWAPMDPKREGYTFTGWNPEIFFSITSDMTITAQYKINTYKVEFLDWDGTVLKTETVEYGKEATAPDNPQRDGWNFTGWDLPYSDVASNLIITAQYTIKTFKVTLIAENGQIIVAETGVNLNEVEYQTTLHLTAVAADNFKFVKWDNGSMEPTLVVEVMSDLTITAFFEQLPEPKKEYTINVVSESEVMGTVSGGGVYKEDTTIIISAQANEGFKFVQWSDGNTDNPRVVSVEGDITYTAEFVEIIPETKTFTLTLIALPEEGGTVIGGGIFEDGTTVVIAAQANVGFRFDGWDDDIKDMARQIIVDHDITLTALFSKIEDGVDNLSENGVMQARKVMENGKVYIITSEGKVFDLNGKRIMVK